MWADPELRAFFQFERPPGEREGGIAQVLRQTFPIPLGGGEHSVEVIAHHLLETGDASYLSVTCRVVVWAPGFEQILDVVEQDVILMQLPRQLGPELFEHDGVPVVLPPAAIIARARRYLAGLTEAIEARWPMWAARPDREPADLLPPPL